MKARLVGPVGVLAGVTLVMTAALFLGAAIIGRAPATRATGATGPVVSASFERPASAGDLDGAVASLQARLDRLPGDWNAWASLGSAYVQQARVTADPAFYAKAEGAFDRSLQEHPDGNEPALTGQASLAAGRHDFAGSLELARQAVDANPYGAAAHGVLGDALLELGRYDEAFEAFQTMVDLRPGIPSYARVSYAWELRGNIPAARAALRQALRVAYSPADAAFVRFYLGELEWNAGDLESADRHYRQGLQQDDSFVPLLAGRAKVAAAQDRVDDAIDAYTTVVERQPQPSYLIELGDLYASIGADEQAQQQYDLVAAQTVLLEAAGVNVDLDLVVYDADHGQEEAAVRAAAGELRKRRSVAVQDAYAWALHVSGRSSEALVHARRAERLGTRSALFAYHKGMIEKALGMDNAARADLRRALRINPFFSTLQSVEARKALHELRQGS